MGALHKGSGALRRDGVGTAVGFCVSPASIRQRLTLESESLTVVDVAQLQIVAVTQAVLAMPGQADVVALIIIGVVVQLWQKALQG